MRQNRSGCGCGCFGCGGAGLLGLIVLAGLAWFLVVKPVRDFTAGWQAPTAQTQSTPAPTGNVNAPLSQADVQKFVRVRRDVRAALGSSFTGLQTTLDQMNAGQNPSPMQVLGALKDTTASVGKARAAQTAALNREKLSLQRYGVIRAGVNRALGLPNIDFAQVAQAVQQGQLPDLNRDVKTASPQEQALVKPFADELRVTAAAGLLGL